MFGGPASGGIGARSLGCAAGTGLAVPRQSRVLASARGRPAFVVGLGSDRRVFVDVPEPVSPDLQAGSGGVRAATVAGGCSLVQKSCHHFMVVCPLGAASPVRVSPLRSGRVGFPAPHLHNSCVLSC